jgi:hypothetical protein
LVKYFVQFYWCAASTGQFLFDRVLVYTVQSLTLAKRCLEQTVCELFKAVFKKELQTVQAAGHSTRASWHLDEG